jgi:intein/homing endonuclease
MKMNWNYLAGFFDGEGYTGWSYYSNREGSIKVRFQITQRNTEVLDEIALFLIEHGLTPRFQPNRTKYCAIVQIYRIHEVEWLLRKLRPLVIVKRDQIDGVLDAIENRQIRRAPYNTKKRREILERAKTGAKLKPR